MTFILASNNSGKLKEMREMLSALGCDVISQKEAGLTLEVEETGTTFEENAFLKAEAACKMSGLPAIADDSGLCVDALGGEPGIYSARYAGEDKSDEDRNLYLLDKMKNEKNRRARFVSAVAVVFPNGDRISTLGECHGELLYAPRGENGFGYDPLFYMEEYKMTTAEMEPELKNKISHRGRAIALLGEKLKEYFEGEKYADK